MADHTRVPEPTVVTDTESLLADASEATQASFDEVQPGLFPDDGIPTGPADTRADRVPDRRYHLPSARLLGSY